MGGLTLTESGERIDLSQTGAETLIIQQTSSPSLSINQDSGAHMNLSPSAQNLTLMTSPTETLVIREADHQTLVISDAGAGTVPAPYGRPYTQAEDGAFYYYAWQHTDRTQWKAQRFNPATLALRVLTGANPQPVSLTDFQLLSF